MIGLLGKKVGMTRLFGDNGESYASTIVELGPCIITQIKTKSNDGYSALQIGYGKKSEKHVNKPSLGRIKKIGLTEVPIKLSEFKISNNVKVNVGDTLSVSIFEEGQLVDVRGISKGKGFTGVVKRHGFAGARQSHGQSSRVRAPGSIGQASDPSRVWKGTKMAGQHGNKKALVRNLKILRIDVKNNHLFLNGSVPGSKDGFVMVTR